MKVLTDNKGRVADFKNCIIIMTSNLGSDEIQKAFENNQSFEKSRRTGDFECNGTFEKYSSLSF